MSTESPEIPERVSSVRDQIDRLQYLADQGATDDLEELATQVEEDVEDVIGALEATETAFQQYDEDIRNEVSRWRDDLRELEDDIDNGIDINIEYEEMIDGDVVIEELDVGGSLLDSFRGPGVVAWGYNRTKRTAQTLKNAYRNARDQETRSKDEKVDLQKRKLMAQIGGVGLVMLGDYSNLWVDDEDRGGEWMRLRKEPSGDIDAFGYGAEQEQRPLDTDKDSEQSGFKAGKLNTWDNVNRCLSDDQESAVSEFVGENDYSRNELRYSVESDGNVVIYVPSEDGYSPISETKDDDFMCKVK